MLRDTRLINLKLDNIDIALGYHTCTGISYFRLTSQSLPLYFDTHGLRGRVYGRLYRPGGYSSGIKVGFFSESKIGPGMPKDGRCRDRRRTAQSALCDSTISVS
jgi:hypothetical protein